MAGIKRKQLTNRELYKYKNTSGLFAREPSLWDKLWRFFVQLILWNLWKALSSVGSSLGGPLARLFSVQIWMGKSLLAITLHVQRQVLKLIGWLSGREASMCRASNFYFGTDVKRWHLSLGAYLLMFVWHFKRVLRRFRMRWFAESACHAGLPVLPAVAIILGGLVHSGIQCVRDRYDERKKRRRALHARMLLSQSYQEWRGWALQIEKLDAEQALHGYKARSWGGVSEGVGVGVGMKASTNRVVCTYASGAIQARMNLYSCVFVYMCICVCVYVCVCMCACVRMHELVHVGGVGGGRVMSTRWCSVCECICVCV
jgi:hypothetical protein